MDSHPWSAQLDRSAQERADDGWRERLLADPATRVIDWTPQGALVDETGEGAPVLALDRRPRPAGDPRVDLVIFLGRDLEHGGTAWAVACGAGDDLDGTTVGERAGGPTVPADPPSTADPSADQAPTPSRVGLRDIGHLLPPLHAEAFMTAQALGTWHRTHRRCPRCGAPTDPVLAGWVRRCRDDGSDHYPRTDPAVIMAVTDPDDRLLLARAPAWPQNRRSVLAGFVEPGERLEMAVAREVAEEVGLVVFDVEYAGSQPWPFPASLMLGFTARTGSADLRIDDGEIAAAEWYTREQLRSVVADGSLGLPGRLSIARRLIEGWFGEPLTPPREVPFHRPDVSHLDGPPSSGR